MWTFAYVFSNELVRMIKEEVRMKKQVIYIEEYYYAGMSQVASFYNKN